MYKRQISTRYIGFLHNLAIIQPVSPKIYILYIRILRNQAICLLAILRVLILNTDIFRSQAIIQSPVLMRILDRRIRQPALCLLVQAEFQTSVLHLKVAIIAPLQVRTNIDLRSALYTLRPVQMPWGIQKTTRLDAALIVEVQTCF